MSKRAGRVSRLASKSVDELATEIRSRSLPSESPLQTLAMALVLKAETMELMLELIYEEVRLLDTNSPHYQRLTTIRDLAMEGSDLWKRCFNVSGKRIREPQSSG